MIDKSCKKELTRSIELHYPASTDLGIKGRRNALKKHFPIMSVNLVLQLVQKAFCADITISSATALQKTAEHTRSLEFPSPVL